VDEHWWRRDGTGIVVSVRVMPGARRSELGEASGDRLRVRVAAPAVEGRANAALIGFIAKSFGVRRSAVILRSGEHSRDKVLHIAGLIEPPDGMTFGDQKRKA
jgi:uncharacterized protein (TIGR00251 family)